MIAHLNQIFTIDRNQCSVVNWEFGEAGGDGGVGGEKRLSLTASLYHYPAQISCINGEGKGDKYYSYVAKTDVCKNSNLPMLNHTSPKYTAKWSLAIASLASMSMGLLSLSMPALADTTTSDWSEWIEMNQVSRRLNSRASASQSNCLDYALDFLRSRRAGETGVLRDASAYGRFGNMSAYLICAPEGDRVLVFVSGPTNQYQQVQELRRTLSNEFRNY